MKETKITLSFPFNRVLKNKERETLTSSIVATFREFGNLHVKLEDFYYEEERAAPAILDLVLVIGVVADVATIALAIREFLKGQRTDKYVRIRTKELDLHIKGNMSDDAVLKLVKEGRKTVEEQE